MKKYLQDNCDYTFETLKTNMPLALASVKIQTIQKWENRMYRCLEAYKDGLGTSEAQKKVREFSSKRYKSHRRVGECFGTTLD